MNTFLIFLNYEFDNFKLLENNDFRIIDYCLVKKGSYKLRKQLTLFF